MAAITTDGSASSSGIVTGSGTTKTLTVVSAVVGRYRILAISLNGTTAVSTVTGGGVGTWTQAGVGSTANGRRMELWVGKVINTTNPTTITVTWAASITGVNIDMYSQMWKAASLAAPVWFLDVFGFVTAATGTTVSYPTLAPRTVGPELYSGASFCANTPSVGSTSGFTWGSTSGYSNPWCYNASTTGSVSPSASQTPSGSSDTVAAIVGVMDGGAGFFGG